MVKWVIDYPFRVATVTILRTGRTAESLPPPPTAQTNTNIYQDALSWTTRGCFLMFLPLLGGGQLQWLRPYFPNGFAEAARGTPWRMKIICGT